MHRVFHLLLGILLPLFAVAQTLVPGCLEIAPS